MATLGGFLGAMGGGLRTVAGHASVLMTIDMSSLRASVIKAGQYIKSGLGGKLLTGVARYGRMITHTMARIAAAAGLIKLILSLRTAIKEAGKFDTSLREIGTLLDKDWRGTVDVYGRSLQELSMRYGSTLEDLTKGTYKFISATGQARGAMNVLRYGSVLARLTLSDTSETMNAFTSVMNAWSESTAEASHIAGTLFQTVQYGNVRMGDVAAGVPRVVAAAVQAKASIEEALALYTVVTRILPPREAATGVSRMFTLMARPPKPAIEAARKYGIALKESSVGAAGLFQWLERLQKLMSPRQAGEIFRRSRAWKALVSAMVQLTEAQKIYVQMMKEQNIVEARSAIIQRGIEAYVARGEAARAVMGIGLGRRFEPMRKQWQTTMTEWKAIISGAFGARGAATEGWVGYLQGIVDNLPEKEWPGHLRGDIQAMLSKWKPSWGQAWGPFTGYFSRKFPVAGKKKFPWEADPRTPRAYSVHAITAQILRAAGGGPLLMRPEDRAKPSGGLTPSERFKKSEKGRALLREIEKLEKYGGGAPKWRVGSYFESMYGAYVPPEKVSPKSNPIVKAIEKVDETIKTAIRQQSTGMMRHMYIPEGN